MAFTESLTEGLSVAGNAMYPANVASSTAGSTGNFAMSSFRRCIAKLTTGVIVSGNVNCAFQSSNATGGTYTNVTNGATIVGNASNSEYTMEIRADQLPTGNSWLRANATTGTGAAFFSLEIFGGESGYKPAKQFDCGDVIARTVT